MKKLSSLLLLVFMSLMFSVAFAGRSSDDHSSDDDSSRDHSSRDHSSDDDSRGERRRGLNRRAVRELREAGVDKYLGKFEAAATTDIGNGWTKHTFDPEIGVTGMPAGPVCIAGSGYSVFTRKGKKNKLLIFEQGGGACWQNFYRCNLFAEDQEPPSDGDLPGIFDAESDDNPFADYSIVYMPYCDGSVFTGDNVAVDPIWQSLTGVPARFHFGLRNQSAGMDLARKEFPKAKRITVAGSSAGGVGAAGFAPFLARMVYGNKVDLSVFNDAGPITSNPDAMSSFPPPIPLSGITDVEARASDWDFGKFYPASCTDCDDMGNSTEIIKWRLDNDSTIREAFYETDADETNRFFLGLLTDPVGFRNLIVSEHGLINAMFPKRYKRFIVAGDTSHTALQSPLFYTQDANGTLLNDWTKAFLKGKKKKWVDIVEDPVFP
ncbi:MAG: pectinacetylesterase family protein [Gammaproteobacteria bacterium]|nr:pectinacetylesterase family protein [Gammaproteobacteria bacterium]